PLVTRVAQPTVSKTGPGASASAPVGQPTSPTAQSTPLGPGGTTAAGAPVVGVGNDEAVTVPGQGNSVATPGATTARDTDGDGLADAAERRLGTDPDRRDTDGDGLPDGWEVSFGLNPRLDLDAVRDPDGDGVDNRYEFMVRSNPREADTNRD